MRGARRNQGVVRLFVGEGLQARFEGEEFRCLSKVSTIVPGKYTEGDTDWLWLRRRRRDMHFCPFEEKVECVSILLLGDGFAQRDQLVM